MFKARLSLLNIFPNLSNILFSKHSSISRLGIFTNCKDNLGEYHSNYESGDGYADITFNNLGGTKACVIEIKVCKEKESRAKKANEAIEQILEKHYADTIFEDENITSVNAVGIAFSGKNCFISVKKLK